VLAGLGSQVPVTHEPLHGPRQGELQQIPLTQLPESQSSMPPQFPPFLFLNDALMVTLDVPTTTLQVVPLELLQPVHSSKTPVAVAVATSWTVVPYVTTAEHMLPQLIPTPIVACTLP
jgi:hypothetical protein